MFGILQKDVLYVLSFVRGSGKVKLKNRGTIVVRERYGLALCFLDVFCMVVR